MPRRTDANAKDPTRRRSAAVRHAIVNPSRSQLSKWEREQRARRMLWLAAAGVAILIVGVLVAGYVREVVLRAQETVAVVHGERISAGDLLAAARPVYQTINRQADQYRDAGLPQQSAQLKQQLPALPGQMLSSEVEQRLIAREAQDRQITVSDAEVDAEIRQQMRLEAEFEQATPAPTAAPDASPVPAPTLSDTEVDTFYRDSLDRLGLNDSQYRREVRDTLLRDKVRQAIVADVPTTAEQVHARHILVADENKANELLQKLQDGATFDDLARAESTDSGSKDKGGDLGWFPRGVMIDTFEQAAFTAEPGSAPQLVRTSFGWHVLQVTEKSQDRPIDDGLLSSLQDRRFQDWLATARQSPDVTITLSPATSNWVLSRLQGRIF